MQNYTEVSELLTLSESRQKFLNNDKTVATMFSGASFPTFDLVLDQWCYRTDQKKLYQITDLTVPSAPVWTMRFDMNSGMSEKPPLVTTGSLTAYTAAPDPVVSAYLANQRFWITFHVASGANPTVQYNGIVAPPNLVKRLGDGSLVNIAAGDIPAGYTGCVRLVSPAQALVEDLPMVGIASGGTGAATPADARAALAAAKSGANIDIVSVAPTTTIATQVIGFRDVPQKIMSLDYTLIIGDASNHVLHPAADITARTVTIPPNSTVAFPIGTAITFVNQNAAGVLTIAITTDVMRLAGQGTTGSRTLAANGIATALKLAATEWIISGAGLT